MGTKGEVQGRWGRSVEVVRGDLGGGEGEGRVGAFLFIFPQPLAFFGFSPLNFLIRAKMFKSKKMTKGGRHDPIFKHSECGHRAGAPMGEVGVVVFLLGGWTLARRNLKMKLDSSFKKKRQFFDSLPSASGPTTLEQDPSLRSLKLGTYKACV